MSRMILFDPKLTPHVNFISVKVEVNFFILKIFRHLEVPVWVSWGKTRLDGSCEFDPPPRPDKGKMQLKADDKPTQMSALKSYQVMISQELNAFK